MKKPFKKYRKARLGILITTFISTTGQASKQSSPADSSARLTPKITIIYQSNCPQCKQVFATIPCLHENNIQVNLIGVGSDKLHLRQQATRYRIKPKLLSFKQARQQGLYGTPSIIFKTANSIAVKVGPTSCSWMLQQLLATAP